MSNGTRVTEVPAHTTGFPNNPTIVLIQRMEDGVLSHDSVIGPFADQAEAHRWLDQQVWFDTSPDLHAIIDRLMVPGWTNRADAEANAAFVDTMSKAGE